ncbi:DUF4345 family protein [Roseimaritima ulvae]|uniref:DUF4345 domain-containing protein n=1 Tax=Roseimaritima ulvae TaxID=980254 RepID=A0A5B9QST5_9BACT|nr:DUF4345 family protein [Roseimaritima ulvae]QEG40116.1 hypothetical protein UC8_21220 [Roseimaritima ulvae]
MTVRRKPLNRDPAATSLYDGGFAGTASRTEVLNSDMNSRFPTAVIFVTAATWAGFAIWLALYPNALLSGFGIESSTAAMRTEIRAFYGGVEMAIAVAMIVLWRRGLPAAALLVGSLPLIGAASGRCIGMLIDGFSAMHAGFAAVEITGAAVCLLASRKSP